MTVRALAAAVFALTAAWVGAQPPAPPRPAPPPNGAGDADVLEHVLATELDGWGRVGALRGGPVAEQPAFAGVVDLLATYRVTCGAAATYRDSEGSRTAEVLLLACETQLDALGLFAAQRGPDARRVLLTSFAYRERDVLHVQSGRYYLRVQATGPPTEALPSDQYLAARLEVRLPQAAALPRIVEFFPRRWLTSLAVSYAPATLLGDDPPMAFSVRRELPLKQVELAVADVGSEAQALRLYTDLLERTMAQARAYEVPRLGQEAFAARNGDCPVMVTRQDQFLGWVCGDPVGNDAEALLRLLGTAIRTSRPLVVPSAPTNSASG